MVVGDSEVLGITCGSCAEATANTMAMCMSIRPLKLLWAVMLPGMHEKETDLLAGCLVTLQLL